MRRLAVLIILALMIVTLLPSVQARGIKNPVRSDVFLYEYFSQVLVRIDYSLRYAYMNDSYSLVLSNLTLRELGLIREEALYYQSRGINTTVMGIIPPFYDLASETVALVQMTLQFRDHPTPALAAGILTTIRRMYGTLAVIDAIKLRNGTRVLMFNTGKVRAQLAAIEKLAREEIPHKKALLIGVSDQNPIINQTITIFGSCPGNSSLTIVISSGNLTDMVVLKPVNNSFSVRYRFETPGSYTVYAIQAGNRSNSVSVNVGKIPSLFLVGGTFTALINHSVLLSGRLVDYYGNPLVGRRVRVGNVTVITNSSGGFSREFFSSTARSFDVPISFEGDRFHSPAVKKVLIVFSRYPVSITLSGPAQVTRGRRAEFSGRVSPNVAPLVVYVSGRPYTTLTPDNGTFSFSFRSNSTGEFRVYVVFNGSEVYDRATSDVVVLKVVPPESMLPRYVAIGLLALLIVAGLALLRGRPSRGSEVSSVDVRIEMPLTSQAEVIPEDVGEAYSMVRKRLSRTFGLSESLTPREVLVELRDWEHYGELENVTTLHEKAVYGGVPLSQDELLEFRKTVETLLGVMGRE